jgi:hypothetical protein
MSFAMGVLAAEHRFFRALLETDATMLGNVLADDFMIVDVMAGSVVAKQPFIDFVASGAKISIESKPLSGSTGRPPSSWGEQKCQDYSRTRHSALAAATPTSS